MKIISPLQNIGASSCFKLNKLSFMNWIIAINRNIVITLHKGVEGNTIVAKKLEINRITAWKIMKKFHKKFRITVAGKEAFEHFSLSELPKKDTVKFS